MQPETPEPARHLPAFTPVPRARVRHNGWTPDRQLAFIEALADTGSVKSAARSIGITDVSAYHLRRQPGAEQFAAAWDAAIDLGTRRLEDIAYDRAINGTEVPVYAFGKIIGTRTVYNDALLMFILRNRANHRYHADTPHTQTAASESHLARLKREWRNEWEAEQRAIREKDAEEVLASLNAKLDRMRERYLAAQTEDDAADDTTPAETPTPTPPAPAPAEPAEPPPAPAPGTPRIIPHLLTSGDQPLGLPHGLTRPKNPAHLTNPGEFPSPAFHFPDAEAKADWQRKVDAGLISGGARGAKARLMTGGAALGPAEGGAGGGPDPADFQKGKE